MKRALPPAIWALGLGSMLMDTSSELVHSLLPVFMASVLGASMVTIGLVEGIAEATAAVLKGFSGVLSDRLGKRKLLMILGYGLSAATKPAFPLASSVAWVLGARVVDRLGKGIRGAPRDALVADITPHPLRGAAFGLRQSLDSVGAFLGPLAALVLMARWAGNIRAVLWVAVAPAVAAVVLLALAVREPTASRGRPGQGVSIAVADARRLGSRFWLVVLLGAVFTLARFSEAFLILRARSVGLALGLVPAVLIVMNVVYAATAYPAGVAADRFPRRRLLLLGLGTLVLADLVLAFAVSAWQVLVGAALWGLQLGLTPGLFSKLVADEAPEELRGTAFGVYQLVGGLAVFGASLLAGALWDRFGPAATFVAGALFAALTGVGILARRPSPAAGR